MNSFNPWWGGLDYTFDTPPADGISISYLPSLVHDVTAGQEQLESRESVHSFMQTQFRMATENMIGNGLIAYYNA